MKILIVDDSSTMRRILANTMEQAGWTEIEQANDGQEAVEMTAANAFDLILMDWNMPRMSGFEALQAIRAAGKKMPIIMVTTEAEKCRVLEALKAGANNYIIKPFKPEMIVAKIQDVLASMQKSG